MAWMPAVSRGWHSSGKTLQVHVFSDAKSTSDLLSTIASGLIAMTSFSFGLLLLAVRQTMASMTSYVVDQFLRRRINRFYFGFFAGLALYSLLALATSASVTTRFTAPT